MRSRAACGFAATEELQFCGVLRRKFNALSRGVSGKNSSFEGVMRRKFAAIRYRFPLSPVSSQ